MRKVSILFSLIVKISLYSQVSIDRSDIKTALSILNRARMDAGLSEVRISPALSDGYYKHAEYLARNRTDSLTVGVEAHKEYPMLKGYTKEGELAGENAVIHYVRPSEAINGWMRTFYHRIPLLQPNLTEIGIGYFYDDGFEVCVLDCISGAKGDVAKEVVYCPDDCQLNVPLEMGPEIPHPVGLQGKYGFPITIYFARWQTVVGIHFVLKDLKNNEIPCYVSTPEAPATYFPQWNSICAIPKEPLISNSQYIVAIKGIVDGKVYRKKFTFHTR